LNRASRASRIFFPEVNPPSSRIILGRGPK